jgi:hypothetical protein
MYAYKWKKPITQNRCGGANNLYIWPSGDNTAVTQPVTEGLTTVFSWGGDQYPKKEAKND